MQRFLVILLVVGFAALPFRLIASENSGCSASACDQTVVDASPDAATSCCAPPAPAEQDGTDVPADQDSEHHGGCDCPLSCCGIVKTVAAVTIKLRKSPAPVRAENSAIPAQDVCGSPHIKRLRRPPRPLTITS